MQRLFRALLSAEFDKYLAPIAIGLGLTLLVVGMALPSELTVFAMSLVTLGATAATIDRFRHSPALPLMLTVHFAIYGSIFAIFIGAELHSANTRFGPRLNSLTIVDVLVSIVPMLVAVRLAWDAICAGQQGDA